MNLGRSRLEAKNLERAEGRFALPLARAASVSGILLAVLGAFLTYRLLPAVNATQPARFPELRAGIGARIDSVQARSTVRLRLHDEDIASEIVETPVSFEYADPERGFPLPPTRYVWLDHAAGRIHSIRTSPQLAYTSWAETRALIEQVVRTIDGAGWPRAPYDPKHPWAGSSGPVPATVEQVEAFFADPSVEEGVDWSTFRHWRSGPVDVRVDIRRTYRAGSTAARWDGIDARSDRFLVNVVIESDTLGAELYEKVFAKRSAAGGTHQTLTTWLREDRNP